jgi:periplasmic protein TonB
MVAQKQGILFPGNGSRLTIPGQRRYAMFNDSLFFGKRKRVARLTWLTLPISMLLHAMVIAGLVVVPLLRADASLPGVKVISVSITAPPTPLPPSRGTGKKNAGTGKVAGVKKAGKTAVRPDLPIPSGTLRVPFKVPETIEEDIIKTGNGSNSSDDYTGIPEGFDGVGPSTVMGNDGEIIDNHQPALRIANVQMPRKIKEVKPVYPLTALAARIQGRVIVEAMTDIFGRVRSARIISSVSPLLNDAALNAIKQWLYAPYVLNGIPKPVVFTVTITFTLAQ